MKRVPDKIDFSKEEDAISDVWKKSEVFRNSVKQSSTRKRFTFYDGPPFATGLPHYGHVLAGTLKDIVTRFAHQSGHHVGRRFGWDCHGLPVEFEIDKVLNITGPSDVMKMGIGKYNAECRKIVMRYAYEWEVIMGRLARWVDFENDYKTLYPWYMESIWWVFHELYVKGFVYKGVKVMPYSTACNTPLSNFESGQNYKDVVDPQVTVGFPLVTEPHVQLVAWTTTPWTLPSNLALCVHPQLLYVKVKSLQTDAVYILMEARLSMLFKNDTEYQVLDKFPGEQLRGLRYEPLFPYFSHLKNKGAFQVLVDRYVSDDAGTGVVQQAPYFGEDDYRVCLAAGVITRDQEIVCPIDPSGRFTQPVSDFVNEHVKDADKKILKYLKEKHPHRLLDASTVKHSYPFCWRSETPLIYRAIPSWFIRVEDMAERLLASSQATYWVPEFVKEGRFGNWLRGARDWAVSRNRYWGTPIPLWVSDDGEEVICVGSIAQLEELTGQKIKDLHRESIDHLTIPSVRPGMPPLRRVPEVFDCWFESGSMPYAQVHFPFTRDAEIAFHKGFPADFIAEGIDQTRGWFYTLLVISTALFNKAPYKNLIAHGLVLAADGQKMSKRKKNYPDPMEMVRKYGADSLRLYLINSPVVRADNLRFKEEGLRDVLKDVLLPWYNAYRYLAQSIERLTTDENTTYQYNPETERAATNTMDKWIRSTTQTMVTTVWTEMARFHLYKVVPILVEYIDQLTNWYIRMNRKRLKGDYGREDCEDAINTLFGVLYTFVRIMAPFTPYLCELLYSNLRLQLAPGSQQDQEDATTTASVHFLGLPQPVTSDIDTAIERRIRNMQHIISAGRIVRDKVTVPMKYPLPELVVIHKDVVYLNDLKVVETYIKEELNMKQVVFSNDCERYGVSLVAEVDHKLLGARLKGDFKAVLQAVKALGDADVQRLLQTGSLVVQGHVLTVDDVFISYRFAEGACDKGKCQTSASKEVALMFNIDRDAAMLDEGVAREVVNLVQKLRKKGQLVPTDHVTVYYEVTPPEAELSAVLDSQAAYIEGLLKAPLRPWSTLKQDCDEVIEDACQLKGTPATIKLKITRGFVSDWNQSVSNTEQVPNKTNIASQSKGKGAKQVTDAAHTTKQDCVSKTSKHGGNAVKTPKESGGAKKALPSPRQPTKVAASASCTMAPCVRHVIVKVDPVLDVKHQGYIIPIENPTGQNGLTVSELKDHVTGLLGRKYQDVVFYVLLTATQQEELADSKQPMAQDKYASKVIVVCPKGTSPKRKPQDHELGPWNLPKQPFINVDYMGQKGTVLLTNPHGQALSGREITSAVAALFGLQSSTVTLRRDGPHSPANQLIVSLQ